MAFTDCNVLFRSIIYLVDCSRLEMDCCCLFGQKMIISVNAIIHPLNLS
jgi:hypothetical protein